MLYVIIAIALAFAFPTLSTLGVYLKSKSKPLSFIAGQIVEIGLFTLAVYSFLYFFNAHEYFMMFLLLVLYIDSRVFVNRVDTILDKNKGDE